MLAAQSNQPSSTEDSPLHHSQTSSPSAYPSWRDLDHHTAHDRFRRIVRYDWHAWCDLEPLGQTFQRLKWRERIKASFGYDPLECPRCGCILQLAEIWEPKRGSIWMKRGLETHRMRRAARLALEHIRASCPRYRQLAFDFDT